MMEKAKTASSTSHSSEIQWQGSLHTRAHQGALSHSVIQPLSCRSLFFFSLFAAVAVANSPRVLVEAGYGSDAC